MRDAAPWLLLPSVVLTLGSVTLLAPHEAALAAPPTAAQTAPAAPAYDDGDGDELLEHWGDSRYAREERFQLGGISAGFALLGAALALRRSRSRKPLGEIVPLPSEADFLKLASPAESASQLNSRKAA